MEAVVYSNFRNNLKNYIKKVNDEYEPLMVVNKNPDENGTSPIKWDTRKRGWDKKISIFKNLNY